MHHVILETPRLRLRPFAEDLSDVGAMLAVLGDPVSMRYYPAPYSPDEVRAWVEDTLAHHEVYGYGRLAIEERETGEVIGDCGPTLQEVDGEPLPELGWHVRRDRQGRGIATEAGAACRDRAFEELAPPFLISLIRPANVPSRRVAEKIGMTVWKQTVFGRMGWAHLVYRIDAEAHGRATSAG